MTAMTEAKNLIKIQKICPVKGRYHDYVVLGVIDGFDLEKCVDCGKRVRTPGGIA